MTHPPHINIETARGLLAGLGVEDIAVRGGFDVADTAATELQGDTIPLCRPDARH